MINTLKLLWLYWRIERFGKKVDRWEAQGDILYQKAKFFREQLNKSSVFLS